MDVQVQKSKELDFDFDLVASGRKTNHWQDMYNQLIDFYEANGHCSFTITGRKQLGNWLSGSLFSFLFLCFAFPFVLAHAILLHFIPPDPQHKSSSMNILSC